MRRETARFECIGDSGRHYTVLERIMEITQRNRLTPPQFIKVKDTRDYITADGQEVKMIDKDTFRIVSTDEILRREEPLPSE